MPEHMTETSTSAIAEEYVRLALSIDQHMPGYVDAYFGPPQWRTQVAQGEASQLPELTHRAEKLWNAVATDRTMDHNRREWLLAHVGAMQTSLELLSGGQRELVREVEELYDVTPVWTDESRFLDAHQLLDELLPQGGTLAERVIHHKESLEVPTEVISELLPYVCGCLRERTRRLIPLPDEESFDVEFVENQPWSAYNWYLGRYRSRIDINTDLPMRIDQLADLLAHEAYPGHHTELATKEAHLVQDLGWMEWTVLTINSPSCVISEGIATAALEAIFTTDELVAWQTEELFPRAGMRHLDAEHTQSIHQASRQLAGIGGNAVFMLHDQQADADSVSRYLQRYGLLSKEQADKRIEFYRNSLYRSYIFTYHMGKTLVDDLMQRKRDASRWYVRLLSEAVTPSQIRKWIEG